MTTTVLVGRYLSVAAAAGVVTFVGHAVLGRLERPILVLDAAGLALFCVTGASTALIGASIVVVAAERGTRNIAFPIIGAVVCFAIRIIGVYFNLSAPLPAFHDGGKELDT